MLARMRRKGNPLALLVGMQTGAATLENSNDVDGARVYYAKQNKLKTNTTGFHSHVEFKKQNR